MILHIPIRVQTALVVVLFLGSLSVLLASTITVFATSSGEDAARERLREASSRMAMEAANVRVDATAGGIAETANQELRAIARNVLRDYPEIEGGFYLAVLDRFAGFFSPRHDKDAEPLWRNDPPPLETPTIRSQAQQSRGLGPGEFVVSFRDVGPSHVAIFTEPVGTERPAALVTWLMIRLSGPDQLQARMRRYAVSSVLALGGMAFALALTWRLGRSLARQRREQEHLRDELRRAEHLAALGRLLAGMAHEIRNPLAGIRSTVQLWQRLPEAARTPESLTAVVGAVDRLNALVGRLLLFSRADNAERRPVDVNQILAEGLDLIAAQAAAQNVVVQRDLAQRLPTVSGSANALRQLVLNLLANALSAMPQGGRLRCSTNLAASGNLIELRITDTGGGIAPEHRPRLFEPFFTTRPEGTGLGLALCREVAESHGGSIALEAPGPGGTTFCLRLPTSPR